MVTMFVKHRVRDYPEWKRRYDEFKPKHGELGIDSATVYRDSEDPHMVIVIHVFDDLNAAQTFARSTELKGVMERAGVEGRPEIWYGEEVETTKPQRRATANASGRAR